MPQKEMNMCFTTHRGKRHSCSSKQHRFLHWRKIDHTHQAGTLRVRHTWKDGQLVRTTWRAK